MGDGYEPHPYWSDRLRADFNLRGTGHIGYSQRYNAWLYRAKRRAFSRAARALVPGGRVLDVGSGTGWVIEQLLDRGFAVEGCDLTDVAVDRLRGRFPDVAFFQAAWGEAPLPRPGASYDALTMFDIAYHVVDDSQWAAGLHDAARLLRPGGAVVVTDRFGRIDHQPASHVRFRSEGRWRAAANKAGLELISADPYVRWLSRDRDTPGFRRLPDRVRGPVEYLLERVVPREPHLRCATLRRVP